MNLKTDHNARCQVSPFEWMIFVLALLVQQNAFVSLPILVNGVPLEEMREFSNPVQRAAVSVSVLVIGGICLYRLRALAAMARNNKVTLLLTGLVVLSAIWSIHPDITARRGISYILTILVAALLPLRFGIEGFMKVLSWSFAISAFGSIAFALAMPQYGIMQEGDLAGCWQGVFCTKELLGSVMAVAVFVEAYILVSGSEKQWWRFGLLAVYCALVFLSRSTTALITIMAYGAGICVYLLWKRHHLLGRIGVMGIVFILAMGVVVAGLEPELAFGALGKDSTMTGRTLLWPVVTELIAERPVLGWGYRALWQPEDEITRRVDDVAGFSVPSSHNTFLEIGLQLGGTGLILIVILIAVGLLRGAQCFSRSCNSLGWFSMMFVVGSVMAGLTTETLGQNQVIEWVVFNALVFSCDVWLRKAQATTPRNRRRMETKYALAVLN